MSVVERTVIVSFGESWDFADREKKSSLNFNRRRVEVTPLHVLGYCHMITEISLDV